MKALLDEAARRAAGNAGLELLLVAALKAADPDDLARQDPERLFAALTRTYERLVTPDRAETLILATPPQSSGQALILDIISPDMPFIVDSVLAALRAMGGAIRMFAHPVVRQNAHGEVVEDQARR